MIKRLKALLLSGLYVTVFFLSQYVAAFIFIVLGGQDYAITHQFLATLSSYILMMSIWIGSDCYYKKDVFKGYRNFQYRKFYKYILYGLGLWLLTTVINAVCLPFFPEYGSEIDTLFENQEHMIRFFVVVIGAPIVEEYLFRGRIQETLKKAFGKSFAVIAQGLIFGVIHPFGLQKIYATVLGISFGWIREKTDNTITSTIMHMTINLIGWGIGVLSSYLLM